MFTAAHTEMEAFDPRPLSRPELADALAAHDRLIARAEANRLAILAAVDALGDDGADAATMGRTVSHRSERAAKQDARVAAALPEMPTVGEALAAGRITTEHASLCAAAAERTSSKQADELTPLAEAMPADRFAKTSREWTNRHEAKQAAEARHLRQRRARSARYWTAGDGMVHLHAELDPVTGASVLASLRQRIDQLWHADGGRDGSPDEERSHEQRAADALAEVITTPPKVGTPHPKHVVHIIHQLASGTAELVDTTPLPDHVLVELGPAAEVIGHVFDGAGQPLWLGRTTRLASRDQWMALIAAHRGCRECGAGIDRCQAHHPHEWERGGASDIDNLVPLCHTCHGVAHRGSRGDPARRRRSGLVA